MDAPPWWRTAVIHEIYVRSFADSNGDGIGDLAGLRERLPYLRDLGVDAIWLTPFYRSPMVDGGYDVADYRAVDPRVGTLHDFDAMLHTAHALGIRVIIDIVPNHSSSQHPWFVAALEAGPGSPERDRYIFRPAYRRSGIPRRSGCSVGPTCPTSTRTGYMRSTGPGARFSTPTPANESRSPRRGRPRRSAWRATSPRTSCTRRSTSTFSTRSGARRCCVG